MSDIFIYHKREDRPRVDLIVRGLRQAGLSVWLDYAINIRQKLASQLNMVSQSWDGERIYFTSSLLANWDKTGKDNEQFLKSYTWDGKKLSKRFEIDFMAEGLGRPHLMRFGAHDLYTSQLRSPTPNTEESTSLAATTR